MGRRTIEQFFQVGEPSRIYECRICDTEHIGHGHTLSQGGVCCDECNLKWVLPLRMRGLHL